MVKALFLNSGGLDSLATAKICQERNFTLHSLFIDLGQANLNATRAAAKQIAAAYCDGHDEVSVSGHALFTTSTPLAWPGIAFTGPLTFVLGAAVARAKELDYIVSGLKYSPTEDTGAFNSAFTALLRASGFTRMVIPVRPLAEMNTEQVYELIKDDPLLRLTHSCHLDVKCGSCKKCQDRIRLGID